MGYRVTFLPVAERAIAKLDLSLVRRIKPKALALAENPRPAGSVKLQGHQQLYRIRIGDYRVVYEIDDSNELVSIALVAHRREVYRDL
jgi:mRNA interferase RelE/StbE